MGGQALEIMSTDHLIPPSSSILVVDVDGTICASREYEYKDAPPIEHARAYMNNFYEAGWYIVYFTARYYRKNQGDIDKIYREGYNELKTWLDQHGFLYHEIRLGKPSGIYYIDNHAWRINNFGENPREDWENLLKHMKENSASA